MATLLLNLRHVPEDEADDVRALLDANGIAWYETQPSRWGISGGGIWLADEHAASAAFDLLRSYQQQRVLRARAEFADAVREGRAPGWAEVLRGDPLRVVAALLATAFVAGLLALPVWLLSR
ncbi:MAG TPA: DUF6164 family protein [Dokdonella sp.]